LTESAVWRVTGEPPARRGAKAGVSEAQASPRSKLANHAD